MREVSGQWSVDSGQCLAARSGDAGHVDGHGASGVSRRTVLAGGIVLAAARGIGAEEPGKGLAVGVASFSYTGRLAQERGAEGLRDPLRFLQFCRERGAAGVQTGVPPGDAARGAALRRYLDETGMWLEGSIRLPREDGDVERFEAEVKAAKAAGAPVLRTVMLSGRRYETFKTADDFRLFRETSWAQVKRAEPAMARHRVRLAVENHKDYRADEFVEGLRRISSEWVGATVDTGNNIALLEAPLETVEALAPWAFSVHLKDMAVEECPEGFLLSEVPFGRGFLDLPRIVAALRRARPDVRFSVEMATRDPLLIPCLTEGYWATFPELPAPVLARALALVRRHPEGRPLPRVSGLPLEERLKLEDENVRLCIRHAAERLLMRA